MQKQTPIKIDDTPDNIEIDSSDSTADSSSDSE